MADKGATVVQLDQTGGMLGQRASTPADFSHSLMPGWARIARGSLISIRRHIMVKIYVLTPHVFGTEQSIVRTHQAS